MAYQGIVAAGPGLDRAKVIAATNRLTHYTAGASPSRSTGSRQHEPATQADPATHGPDFDCNALVKVRSGTFQIVGDPAKPWLCWPGTTRAWSEPKSMTFR